MEMVHIILTDLEESCDWHFYVKKSLVSQYAKVGRDGYIINSPKPYKIRIDPPAPPHSKKHIHIFKNGDFVIINVDGTRREGDGKEFILPKKLYDWIERNLPDFDLPDDRIIYFRNMPLPDCDDASSIRYFIE